MEFEVSTLFSCGCLRNAVPLQRQNEKGMKRKTIGIIIAVLVLTLAGGIGWSLRDLPQKRLLTSVEDIVFTDVDSAARVLERVDTTMLTESAQMRYDLMRAFIHEERWHLGYADTVSHLSSVDSTILASLQSREPRSVTSTVWIFKRKTIDKDVADKALLPDSSTLMRVYHYYERESLGGTADDKQALQRYGRICYALSRHHKNETSALSADKLIHLAIHCAEASADHTLAFRAYWLLGQQSKDVLKLLCCTRALEHYRLSVDHSMWLLTLLNDYGAAVLRSAPFDLHRFPSLERVTALAAGHREVPASICDSVFQCLDSLWALPAPEFAYTYYEVYTYDGKSQVQGISVPADLYDMGQKERKYRPNFKTEWQKAVDILKASQETQLSAGYVMKTTSLQRRLMTATIAILILGLLLLALLSYQWRNKMQLRHEAERMAHEREAEQMAERLRQKDTAISMLRGHIMDKSEILEMLEPTSGKRTVINARNWREIELTLDTADGNFVSRLRAAHPEFSEEDIRLCLLARLKLSNMALSAIYLISVSAVQHRKQKLKKEGFGVADPTVTLDQIIADF